jgi:guanylate kinase
MAKNPGKLIIISSPSGGGKSTICRKLLARNKKDNWVFSVSVTTRPKRENERNGREYKFVEYSEFVKLRNRGEFAESCQVHRYYYGTPKAPINKIISNGGVMLFDVDVKGAKKLKDIYRNAVTIFILPPSQVELKRRLKRRGTEDDKHFKIRQKRAISEMKLYKRFEYVVVNNDLNRAVKDVEMIVKSVHCRQSNLNMEQIRLIIG